MPEPKRRRTRIPLYRTVLRQDGDVLVQLPAGRVRKSKDLAIVARAALQGHSVEECVLVIALDGGDPAAVCGVEEIARGTPGEVCVNRPAIIRAALLMGSERFVLVHTHPMGDDCQPSRSDERVTHEVADMAIELDLTLIDHVIVGPRTHFSFRDKQEKEGFWTDGML